MKRLIPATIVAIGIHSLLMSMDFNWMDLTDVNRPSTGSVTIILESVQPQTIKPKSEPLPPKQFPPEVEKNAVESATKTEPPLPPIVQKKPVRVTQKPKKKPPIVKPAPAKQDKPAEPKIPSAANQTPSPPLESVPDGSSQGNDAPVPSQEETSAFEAAATGSVSNQPALPSVLKEAKPEYRANPPISYPKRARRKGYEGTVLLEVLVNRNGKVDDLRILVSSGYAILDSSALKSVRTWSFEPAKMGKDTVDMWVKVPVRFKLE